MFHTNSRIFHCFQILLHINDRTSYFTSFAILEAGKEMAGKPWSNTGWLLAQEVRKKIFFLIFKIFFWISRRFLDCKLSSSFLKRYLLMHKFLRICNSSLDLTLFDDDLYKNCDLKQFSWICKIFSDCWKSYLYVDPLIFYVNVRYIVVVPFSLTWLLFYVISFVIALLLKSSYRR